MSTLEEPLVESDEEDETKGPTSGLSWRWFGLACCLLFVEFTAGMPYAYGVYSAALGDVFDWNDGDLASISSLADIGLYIGLDGGFFFDRFGPTYTLLIGGLLTGLGYTLVYLTTIGVIATSVPVTTVLFFITFHGASWLDCAGIATTLRNFSANSALIIGLVKSFFGLSGSIVSQVYLTFFIAQNSSATNDQQCFPNGSLVNPSTNGSFDEYFLPTPTPTLNVHVEPGPAAAMPIFLFLGAAGVVGTIISMIFTRLVKNAGSSTIALKPKEVTKVYIGYGVVTALALLMGIAVVFVKTWSVSTLPADHTYVNVIFGAVITLLVGLGTLLVIPCSSSGTNSQQPDYRKAVTEGFSDYDDSTTLREKVSDTSAVCMKERNLLQSLACLEFWLLFFIHFLGTGAGLMIINQIAQISLSYGDKRASATIFVTIVGVSSLYVLY